VRTAASAGEDETASLVLQRIDEVEAAIGRWRGLERSAGEARLYPLSKAMAGVYAAALLVESAAWESSVLGSDRKALVARLYARSHLSHGGPLAELDHPAEDLERFKELWDGALVDDRVA
jgi:hypothetical protein